MISLFQDLHAFFYGHNHKYDYKHNNKVKWLFCNIFARFFEKLVYYFILIRGNLGFLPKPLNNNNKLVVSFTSFPARINYVWMVVDTLMRQNFPPRCIFLYLSREQFPNERVEIPARLIKYEKLGLRIIFVDEDLKPHKKYFYASQELSEDCFVTVDDDLLYRTDVLERLWKLHTIYPNSVCANIGRRITIVDGNIADYAKWQSLLQDKVFSGVDIIATGCGGILYPPYFYQNRDLICDKKSIFETSLRADDLWLKAMELLTNTDVIVSSYYSTAASIPNTEKSALSMTNRINGNTGNDVQWKKLDEKFGINKIIIDGLSHKI